MHSSDKLINNHIENQNIGQVAGVLGCHRGYQQGSIRLFRPFSSLHNFVFLLHHSFGKINIQISRHIIFNEAASQFGSVRECCRVYKRWSFLLSDRENMASRLAFKHAVPGKRERRRMEEHRAQHQLVT